MCLGMQTHRFFSFFSLMEEGRDGNRDQIVTVMRCVPEFQDTFTVHEVKIS